MDRQEVERRLERVVRGHRFTIAVVFPLVGAVLLVASAESYLPAPLEFNPILILIGVLVMRLPLVATVIPIVDRRAAGILLAVTAYVYWIELVGVVTGWPYGAFTYGVDLGPMVAGIPLALPVFFLPLVLDAYLLSILVLGSRAERRSARLVLAVLVMIAIDLVLDPAAVGLGFWTYFGGGAYYGVPASNFAGWLLSGTVAVVTVELAFPQARIGRRLDDCEFALDDLVSFVLLWGTVNVVYANWIPVAVALLLVAGLLQSERIGRPALAELADSVWRGT